MFIWDFSVIIAVGASLFLSLVIGGGLFYINKNQSLDKGGDWRAFKQCPYCAYVFLNYRQRKDCPRCKSLLDS